MFGTFCVTLEIAEGLFFERDSNDSLVKPDDEEGLYGMLDFNDLFCRASFELGISDIDVGNLFTDASSPLFAEACAAYTKSF